MKPLARIVAFAIEQAASLPVSKRISIYRDLAAISANRAEAKAFLSIANDLTAIERRCLQLRLDLGEESTGSGTPSQS